MMHEENITQEGFNEPLNAPHQIDNSMGWKQQLPKPVFDNRPDMVELYWKAWEFAHDHIKVTPGMPQNPYMDEAFSETDIWIWDSCFMAHFCKYAPHIFPGIETMQNFYQPIHDQVKIPLRIHILDNPPLFAWTEYEYYRLTNDRAHISTLLETDQYLQKHFAWFENPPLHVMKGPLDPNTVCLRKADGGFLWEGGRSGMDNTPRGRTGTHARVERPNNPKMLWVDAIAQQGLSALYISRLAKQIGNEYEAAVYQEKYQQIKLLVNQLYWNAEDGIYYDVDVETKQHLKVKTPASFWPMLAEMCSNEQAEKMVKLVDDPDIFGGPIPWVTLARNDADFDAETGNYWRGAMWLPTAYMGIKALEKYAYWQPADESAFKVVEHMVKTYKSYDPHTIWECYNPNKPLPAEHCNQRVRPDFCGWSALGPIALLIENILGFHLIDAQRQRIEWRLHQAGRHGIKQLQFGNITTDIMSDGTGTISVTSDNSYTLVINGIEHPIQVGNNTINIREL